MAADLAPHDLFRQQVRFIAHSQYLPRNTVHICEHVAAQSHTEVELGGEIEVFPGLFVSLDARFLSWWRG